MKAWLAHPLTRGLDINNPRTTQIRKQIIQKKSFLRQIYQEWYASIAAALPVDQKIRFGTTKLKYLLGKQVKTFAFGIYQPPGNKFLHAGKGLRDRDNSRVLIPLPLVSSRISINSKKTTEIVSKTDSEYRDIKFGDRFILIGQNVVKTVDGVQIQLVWKSMTKQNLSFAIAVHLVDNKGNILSQLDYPQDKVRSIVEAGAQWLDKIDIPNSRLENVVSLGIGIYSAPNIKLLPVDKGPRDWNGQRLLIALSKVN